MSSVKLERRSIAPDNIKSEVERVRLSPRTVDKAQQLADFWETTKSDLYRKYIKEGLQRDGIALEDLLQKPRSEINLKFYGT